MAKGKKGFQPGNTLGQVFTRSRQPQNKGRKPTLYKQLLKTTSKRVEFEMSKEDYYKVIRYLMERTPGELKKIAKSEDTPIWVSNIISALSMDLKTGRLTTINTVFDRLFGKATQTIEGEIEGNITVKQEMDLSVLSDDELYAYGCLLEKIRISNH